MWVIVVISLKSNRIIEIVGTYNSATEADKAADRVVRGQLDRVYCVVEMSADDGCEA